MQHIASLQTVLQSDSPLRRSVLDRLLGPYAQNEALITQISQAVGAEAQAWDIILRSQVEANGLTLGCERYSRYLSATKPLTIGDAFSAYQAIAAAFQATAGDRRRSVDMPIESRFRNYVQELTATGVAGRGIPRPLVPLGPRKFSKPSTGRSGSAPKGGAPRSGAPKGPRREGEVSGPNGRKPVNASAGNSARTDGRVAGSGPQGRPKRDDARRSGPNKGGSRPSREAPATRPDPGVTGVIKDPLKFLAQQAAKSRKRNGVL